MTDKLNKTSLDMLNENISKLKHIFPNVFSEGKVDFKKLKETLGEFVDSNDENYSFSWAGRSNSIKTLQRISHGTLIPNKYESVNFDDTENIFIEGENLEVLKLLQKSYFNKIKMIYIDPPYNTGTSAIYKNDFSIGLNSYLDETKQSDGGIKLTTNPETSGRFHSDWISFMYERLTLSRELLKDDGIILITIDDNELFNLGLIMNEIFGIENHLGTICIVNKADGRSDDKFIATAHEYMLVYAKNFEYAQINELHLSEEIQKKTYPLQDSISRYQLKPLMSQGVDSLRTDRPNLFYPVFFDPLTEKISLSIISKNSIKLLPVDSKGIERRWSSGPSRIEELIKNNEIVCIRSKITNQYSLQRKVRIKFTSKTKSFWYDPRYNAAAHGTKLIDKILNKNRIFDFPKSLYAVMDSITIGSDKNSIILDFFSGSGTTAHAVLELNKKDGGTRKFICVQIPEICDKNSEAFKNGFKIISDITKERIRKSIDTISDELKQLKIDRIHNYDLGFKVFKLAKSNYKVWKDVKDETKLKEQLKLFENPLIENYKDIDVVYEIIIKEGYSLNSKIEEISTKHNKTYKVTDGEFFFYVTLDKQVNPEFIEQLKLDENVLFVCLDSAINDSQKTNLSKICKLRTI